MDGLGSAWGDRFADLGRISNSTAWHDVQVATAVTFDDKFAEFFSIAIVEGVLIIGWIMAAVLMFRHKRRFVFMWFALMIVTVGLNIYGVYVTPGPISPSDQSALTRSIITMIIWGPYLLISKRVKNTFIH